MQAVRGEHKKNTGKENWEMSLSNDSPGLSMQLTVGSMLVQKCMQPWVHSQDAHMGAGADTCTHT